MGEFMKDFYSQSLLKTYRKKIYSKFLKSLTKYNLLKENDKIAVCISGGKDSFLLAKCFSELHKYTKIPFSLEYIVMNPGYKEEVIESLEKLIVLCEKAEKENKIIRCRKLTVKLADNRGER